MSEIAPSWEVFGRCERYGAGAREPCKDMRGVPKGWVPNRKPRPLANPHPGRKRLPK